MQDEGRRNPKVLVVDDDPFQRELMAALLRAEGVGEVLEAASGAEALAMLAREAPAPDLILCDLQMPGMDGVELLRHLADRGCRSALALISGQDTAILKTAVAIARERGLAVAGGVAKPVTREAVAALLCRGPNRHAARAPVAVEVEALRRGIVGGELELHYQPKVRVEDRTLAGVEALVRWRRADGRLVPPDAFIPVAERHGLIDALTAEVLRLGLAQAARWRGGGLAVPVAINLSMDNLRDPAVVGRIVEAVAAAGLEPDALVLEITESRLAQELTLVKEILARLRLAGFALAIDDFGTGFSSLKQLQDLPFTELKIDRAFVAGAAEDASRQAILEASASIGARLGLTVVAEGVEDAEDWGAVAAAGCHLVQGWHVARPMPAAEFERWAGLRGPDGG
ncbi:EAL domain-containing response regulator [Inmirania thermothiophila]|uniref:EAL domain-containing protein (Putative c-di-GMP-specific phosphodiesterase class I) n=1 Tax=Inmirania thermothiophila TaxID=1750597 RepID=A0A3N1Y8S6_9GAMM|nr:EAL domain-containing response regulator [Inmirania thermothiophila]ROR35203.1 EAL domain-containing protein (putative c-di-GMP-specific phosphodiesterase class I) [Inmirania thermothiophila]